MRAPPSRSLATRWANVSLDSDEPAAVERDGHLGARRRLEQALRLVRLAQLRRGCAALGDFGDLQRAKLQGAPCRVEALDVALAQLALGVFEAADRRNDDAHRPTPARLSGAQRAWRPSSRRRQWATSAGRSADHIFSRL